jgi:hypothetical protein
MQLSLISPRPRTLAVLLATVSLVPLAATQEAHPPAAIGIPASVSHEHVEIRAALDQATREPGRVGAAARDLANVLRAHFVREEQIALPPLGLLASLSRGELTADMQKVLPLTDSLRAEMPRMLEEHRAIREATNRLEQAARSAGNVAVVRLTETLKLHAQSEEDVTYPAALLVGTLVQPRAAAGQGACGHSGACPHAGTCPHGGTAHTPGRPR